MPGKQSLSPFEQQLARTLIETELLLNHIVEEVGCSLTTVYNYKKNLRIFNDCLAPSISKMGRPSNLTREMCEVCLLSKEQNYLLYVLGFNVVFE